ncbi:N2227-domain-containing protein [Flagelloscypha sp. PMI_526]|nr:N2227-domain-containing protein [Flagelloscypha sp. PMI_526]
MSSEEQEENAHFASVVATFKDYARYSLSTNNRRRKDIYSLSRADQELISKLTYKSKLDQVDEAIQANANFLKNIVASPDIFGPDDELDDQGEGHSHSHDHDATGHSHSHDHGHSHSHGPRTSEFNMDKLRSTLKQLVRDWSEEGASEREKCYEPLIHGLLSHFSDIPPAERRNFRVLVPGAGLGRLAFDIAKLGFACQGNEFSHYMLLASYFMLNKTKQVNEFTIYPYIHSFSNIDTKSSMLRPITIPDVLPSDLPKAPTSHSWQEIYGGDPDPDEPQSGLWDAVLTCFFIDTAKNIVNYLRIIHKILAPGGVWINLGPLLWHWENNESNDPSIELDLEEVKALAQSIGLEIVPESERTIETTYTNNERGMLQYTYKAAYFVAKKVV